MRRFALLAAVLSSVLVVPRAVATPTDPAFTVGTQLLADSLSCSSPQLNQHPDKEPVLLVHGTFTKGHEQYSWNWELMLASADYDYCVVTYPDRGMNDQQISAEYVAYAVMTMQGLSGRKVDMVGHSQGASMPRWAIKYWPSVQAGLDDFVLIAGPNHGTEAGGFPNALVTVLGGQPPAFYQFSPSSRFNAHVNQGDETPGTVDYTSVYSYSDELVQPALPVPTAALEWGQVNPHVLNVNVQDACPGRAVDHVSIGTTDAFVMALAIDAFKHAGPADLSRLDRTTCTAPNQYVTPSTFAGMQGACCGPTADDFANAPRSSEEPPTSEYAITQDS
jgi:pimeloyl-ACP methyl ester carboxylesterase